MILNKETIAQIEQKEREKQLDECVNRETPKIIIQDFKSLIKWTIGSIWWFLIVGATTVCGYLIADPLTYAFPPASGVEVNGLWLGRFMLAGFGLIIGGAAAWICNIYYTEARQRARDVCVERYKSRHSEGEADE